MTLSGVHTLWCLAATLEYFELCFSVYKVLFNVNMFLDAMFTSSGDERYVVTENKTLIRVLSVSSRLNSLIIVQQYLQKCGFKFDISGASDDVR